MNLKELRVFKGFSQQNAAKLLGISIRTYKRYENDFEYKDTPKYKAFFATLKSYKKTVRKFNKVVYPEITIIGAGYVGLNTGKVLSRKCKINFVDCDETKIKSINKEKIGFAVNDIGKIKNIQNAIICLPTNFDDKTGKYDTKDIEKTVENLIRKNKNVLIILKSTVSVGYTDYLSKKFNHQIFFMPEFLREKSALQDSLNPSRLIIGAQKATPRIQNFAKCVEKCIDIPQKTIFLSNKEAETVKLFSNAYLAMRVAFFNEVDNYALKENLNSKNVINAIGLDPRIGTHYNNPSFCYSGYCLPKDTKALLSLTESELFEGIASSNEKRKDIICNKIIKLAKEKSAKPTIGIYKLETQKQGSKLRLSSTLEIYEKLKKYPVKLVVFDENYKNSFRNFDEFIKVSDLIICNTYDDKLHSVKNKVFTRDLLSK